MPTSHTSPVVSQPARSVTSIVTVVTTIVAVATLLVWYWSRLCYFPSVAWNDMRLAPTIALSQGFSIYPTATEGTINTWTYGPLPVLYYWPAAWASTAAGAITLAAILNAALTFIPLAVVCFWWPNADDGAVTWRRRSMAFLLCLAAWPPRHYEVIFADNVAIACGLLGSVVLVRARGPQALWLAAFFATAALACKQITLGIPLSQVLWIAFTAGRRAAFMHAVRCVIAGTVIGAAALIGFGGPGLWFVLMELPSKFPWDFTSPRVISALPEAALQIGAPLTAMLVWRHAFSRPTLLLPATAWLCTLPFGIMALFKSGGWLNSSHSLALWLPPVLATLFTSRWRAEAQSWLTLGGAFTVAAITCFRIVTTPSLPLRPQVGHYIDAERIAAKFKEQIWFPLHPLTTLYSDHRYYHDEDGFYVRRVSLKGIGPEQAAAHLPPKMRFIGFSTHWNDWGIAKSMLPANPTPTFIGSWVLLSPSAPNP
jgi:hypothetical protein